jgi:uroporphyrinogen-III decarboxylase
MTDKALMGGVDHQNTIPNGSPADVVAEARQALEQTGGRRFLLAPECSIDPQAPEENLRALVEVAGP